jgi:prevent-host-death family protein
MTNTVSKSQFKPKALQFFREVEKTGKPLVITDRGKPVLKIIAYSAEPAESLKILRNSVVKYQDPMEPVGLDDWDTLK